MVQIENNFPCDFSRNREELISVFEARYLAPVNQLSNVSKQRQPISIFIHSFILSFAPTIKLSSSIVVSPSGKFQFSFELSHISDSDVKFCKKRDKR